MAPTEDEIYHPVDAVEQGIKGATVTGAIGFFASAIKNAMATKNYGALGVFTRSGGIILTFTAVGGVLEFAKAASGNIRQKKDQYNDAIGGFLAGSVLGLRVGRIPAVLGYGAFTSIVLATLQATGGHLSGNKNREQDEFERKEKMRLNRRRPIEETLAEVGEGRGIKPPGYAERRAQRLKENYGVDINPVSAQ